jgi:hypothetical protein
MDKAPFDINDMGLTIGDMEDNDFCRGFGFNTNENEDDYFENEETNEIIHDEINDKAPEMPQEFYHNLDSFLTRAPPKLTESSGVKKKTKPKASKELAPMFPTIVQKNERTSDHHNSPPIPPSERQQPAIKNKSKSVKEKNTVSNGKKLGTQIDPSLLSEAFEYTDRLLREAVIEEAQQQQKAVSSGHTSHSGYSAAHRDGNEDKYHVQQSSQPPRHTKSAPEVIYGNNSAKQRSGSGSNKEGGNSVNAIRRLKSNKQTGVGAGNTTQKTSSSSSNLNTGFNTTTEGESDSRRNVVDFDELVANFQTGATLQRLRKELEASQASMASSQSYLRNLSKDYFR